MCVCPHSRVIFKVIIITFTYLYIVSSLGKCMDDGNIITLDSTLRAAVSNFFNDRNYSIWTREKYSHGIDRLFAQYDYLDKKRCKKILANSNPNHRALLNLILKSAAEYDIKVPNFKFTTSIKSGRNIPNKRYSIEEIRGIIGSLPTQKSKQFFKCTFSIGSGLRISETIKMKWHRFNWSSWIMNREEPGEFTIVETKRNNSYTVPVPSAIMEILIKKSEEDGSGMEMLYMGDGVGFKKIPSSKDFVFKFDIREFDESNFYEKNEPKKWMHLYVQHVYNYIQYFWIKKYISKHLGHSFKLHSLRHSRSSQLLKEGVDISIISKMLGHKSLSTTMIYLSMTSIEQAKAIKNIPIV